MKSLGVRDWGGRVGWVLDGDFSCVVYHLSLWETEGLEGFGPVLLFSGGARRFYLAWGTGEFGPCIPLWGNWRIWALHPLSLRELEDFRPAPPYSPGAGGFHCLLPRWCTWKTDDSVAISDAVRGDLFLIYAFPALSTLYTSMAFSSRQFSSEKLYEP